jgi:DNA primase
MLDYRIELENRGLDPYDSGSHYLMMNCPMHEDSNPSFSVSLLDGSYRCFGCEGRGTFAELIAALDDITVAEAIAKIRSDTSVDDNLSVLEASLEDEDNRAIVFNEKSFHKVFIPIWGTPAEWYLRAKHGAERPELDAPRSLRKSIISRFDVRWAATGRYVGRVVLPIRMPSGKITSYVGRTVYAGTQPKTKKSISPMHTLFGIHELLSHFGSVKSVVLVEGEFDAMYLQQFGVPALANMGTSILTKYQIRILRSLKAMVVLSYDGDKAGRIAMFGDGNKRVGEMSTLSRMMPTIAVNLPDGKDPNALDPYEIREVYGRFIK